jgi:ACT domain-containing protein
VKIGDVVKLVEHPNSEWFYQYKDRLFEVDDVFERHCRVRMLNVPNPQRYWFAQKNNFEVVSNEGR